MARANVRAVVWLLLAAVVLACSLVAARLAVAQPPHGYHDHSGQSSKEASSEKPPLTGCWSIVPSANPGQNSSGLGDVAVIAANDVWAVGDYFDDTARESRLLFEHWDGNTWTVVPSPNPGTSRTINSIAALSANDVWAVGEYGSDSLEDPRSLTMHWDGTSWSVVPSPNPADSINTGLYDVDVASANDAWAVGDYHPLSGGIRTLTMHWDGSAWSIVPSPSPAPGVGFNGLGMVAAVSGNDVWALGSYSGSISGTLAIHWNGSDWETVPFPRAGTLSNLLYDLVAISTNDLWAVGWYRDGTLRRTLTAHWDGAQWSIVPSPVTSSQYNYLYGVGAASASDVWAVGNYYAASIGYWQELILHWDGGSWSVASSPARAGRYGLSNVDASPSGEAWAVGSRSVRGTSQTLVERFVDPCPPTTPAPSPTTTPTRPPSPTPTPVTGCLRVWNVINSPNHPTYSNTLSDVAVISADDIWAVGDIFGNGEALIMHWNGSEWAFVPGPDPGTGDFNLEEIEAISADDVWAVGYYYSRVTYDYETLTMHWDGREWSVVPSPNIPSLWNYLHAVDSLSSTDVWAVGIAGNQNFQPIAMRWNGTEWSMVPTPQLAPGYPSMESLTAISADDVWAVGDNGSDPFMMHWDGVQWETVDSPGGPFANELHSVDALSSNDVWAVGSYLELGPTAARTLVMHWDGNVWTLVPSPNASSGNNYLYALDVIASDDIWAVGEYYDTSTAKFRTLVLHWNGSSWTVVPSANAGPENSQLSAVAALGPGDVWAVGDYYSESARRNRTLVERYTRDIFTDVHPSNYFYEAVYYLYCGGVVSGYSDNTFRPWNYTTRAQLAKIVVLAEGWPLYTPPQPTFTDVPPEYVFYPYIETAYYRGIISGYSDGTFRPWSNVTRGQLCKIVVLAEGWQLVNPPNPTFSDVPVTNPFYAYIETAYSHDIISGYFDGTFRLGNNAIRGQICKIVHAAVTGR